MIEITPEMAYRWTRPDRYTLEQLKEIAGEREVLSPMEILSLKIPIVDRLAVILRPEVLDDSVLRRISCDFVERGLRIFERRNPDEKRVRRALEAGRAFAAQAISSSELASVQAEVRELADQLLGDDGNIAWAAAGCVASKIEHAVIEVIGEAMRSALNGKEEIRWQLNRVRDYLSNRKLSPVVDTSELVDGSVSVRLAKDDEGPVIQGLLPEIWSGLDWGRVYPYWLIAEVEDEPVGVLQVCPGLPVGRSEMLATKEDLPHTVKKKVVYALIVHSCQFHAQNGSQMVSTLIPFELKKYKEILKHKFGGIVLESGHIMVKRLV